MQQQQQQTEQTLLMAADASRKISAGDVLEGRKSQPMGDFGKQRSLLRQQLLITDCLLLTDHN